MNVGTKGLAYFFGWVMGWSWIPICLGVVAWFFLGLEWAILAFVVLGLLLVASGIVATIAVGAGTRGKFEDNDRND